MYLYILCLLLIIFAIIGLTECIRIIKERVVFGTKKPVTVSVIPLCGHVEDAELLIRSAVSAVKWEKQNQGAHVILVDNGMDEETLHICNILRENEQCISICKKEELDSVVCHKFDLQTSCK